MNDVPVDPQGMLQKVHALPSVVKTQDALQRAEQMLGRLSDLADTVDGDEFLQILEYVDRLVDLRRHDYRLAVASAARTHNIDGSAVMQLVFRSSGMEEARKFQLVSSELAMQAQQIAGFNDAILGAKDKDMLLWLKDSVRVNDGDMYLASTVYRTPQLGIGGSGMFAPVSAPGGHGGQTLVSTLLRDLIGGSAKNVYESMGAISARVNGSAHISQDFLQVQGVSADNLRTSPELQCTAENLVHCRQAQGFAGKVASLSLGSYIVSGHELSVDAGDGATYQLAVQGCGFAVLHQDIARQESPNTLWTSSTSDKGSACALVLQDSGDLVIVDEEGKTHFTVAGSAALTAHDEADSIVLSMQSDGNLVLYKGTEALWATGTYGRKQGPTEARGEWLNEDVRSASFKDCSKDQMYKCQRSEHGDWWNRLLPGQVLETPYSLRTNAPGMDAYLRLQHDCNLVLLADSHDDDDSDVLWASSDDPQGGHCFFMMQGDGRLLIVERSGDVRWDVRTDKVGGIAELRFQDDGNVVAYRTSGAAVWATDTYDWDSSGSNEGYWKDDFEKLNGIPGQVPCDTNMPICLPKPNSMPRNVLPIGYSVGEYERIEAFAGGFKYSLFVQNDGNVVLEKIGNNGAVLEVVWASHSQYDNAKGPHRLAVMTDTFVHVLDGRGNSVWDTGFGWFGLQRGVLAMFLEEGSGKLTLVDIDGGTKDLWEPDG